MTVRHFPGGPFPVVWSRDGRTLYQMRRTVSRQYGLFAIDVASGAGRRIRDAGDLAPYTLLSPGLRLSLSPDGKSIVYAVNRPREEIWLLDGLQPPRPWYAGLWRR